VRWKKRKHSTLLLFGTELETMSMILATGVACVDVIYLFTCVSSTSRENYALLPALLNDTLQPH